VARQSRLRPYPRIRPLHLHHSGDTVRVMNEGLDMVVATAMQSSPGLEHGIAEEMAARALYLAEQQSEADAPEVARTLMVDFEEYGASTTNAVAVAAVDWVSGQVIEPEH